MLRSDSFSAGIDPKKPVTGSPWGHQGLDDPHPRPVVKATALVLALGFELILGVGIAGVQLAAPEGGGQAKPVAGVDIRRRQPNGMALGMDHWDGANQLGPGAASAQRNQLARSEVHGARVVPTLKLRLACMGAPETAPPPWGMPVSTSSRPWCRWSFQGSHHGE